MAYIRKVKGKVPDNPLLAGVRGKLGKTLVVKQYKGAVVISNMPSMRRVKPSAKQKENRKWFEAAVEFAKETLADPIKKAAYARKHKGRRITYHSLISDFMKDKTSKEKL